MRSYASRTSSLVTSRALARRVAASSGSGRCPRSIAASVEVGIPEAVPNSGWVIPARMRRSESSACDRSSLTTAPIGAPRTSRTAASLSICGDELVASQPRIAFSLMPASLPSSPGLKPRSCRSPASARGSKPRITRRLTRRTLRRFDARSRESILSRLFRGVTLCNSISVYYFEVRMLGEPVSSRFI